MNSIGVYRALVSLHVAANVVWIGALLAVSLLLSRSAGASADAGTKEAGVLARVVHVRLAVPAFVTSFAAGSGVIALAPMLYAKLPWFHAKLTLALIVIAVHHVIGSRAKRAAGGDRAAGRGAVVLGAVVFACATGAVFLGVMKSLP
ncbi:MAG: CopD family protein [Polyangiaceae bacterium]